MLTLGTGIGGGISNEGEMLFEPLPKALDERTYIAIDIVPLQIVGAKLGNRAGIYGAYSIAKSHGKNLKSFANLGVHVNCIKIGIYTQEKPKSNRLCLR